MHYVVMYFSCLYLDIYSLKKGAWSGRLVVGFSVNVPEHD